MTPKIPLDCLLEKIEEAISNQPPIQSDKEEKNYLKCPHYLGYLYKSRKNTSIPE